MLSSSAVLAVAALVLLARGRSFAVTVAAARRAEREGMGAA